MACHMDPERLFRRGASIWKDRLERRDRDHGYDDHPDEYPGDLKTHVAMYLPGLSPAWALTEGDERSDQERFHDNEDEENQARDADKQVMDVSPYIGFWGEGG